MNNVELQEVLKLREPGRTDTLMEMFEESIAQGRYFEAFNLLKQMEARDLRDFYLLSFFISICTKNQTALVEEVIEFTKKPYPALSEEMMVLAQKLGVLEP